MSLTKFGRVRPCLPMLDGLMVEYYGNPTPINQVATVNTPDARTIVVKPWRRKTLSDIERAIVNSDLGLNPQNDGEIVRLNIPPPDRRASQKPGEAGEERSGKWQDQSTQHSAKTLMMRFAS